MSKHIIFDWLDTNQYVADLNDKHKIWYLMLKNERIIEILKSVYHNDTIPLGIISLKLSRKEYNLIYSASELLLDFDQLKVNIMPIHLGVILDALEVLTRFRVRSESRTTHRECMYIFDVTNRIYHSLLKREIGIE
uniref:Uncharacterized protein n=1 Tax=Cansystermes virus TaxID=2796581 RepID=A0A7T7K8S4_9VIRU|nr:hypothetical protein [Cansystermes virus]